MGSLSDCPLVRSLGYHNVGWHHTDPVTGEARTPHLDALVRDGIELQRHYTYPICSPSRSSFHSGRNPLHVNLVNTAPDIHNPADPVGGFHGIPRNMTALGNVMTAAGWSTAFIGKWGQRLTLSQSSAPLPPRLPCASLTLRGVARRLRNGDARPHAGRSRLRPRDRLCVPGPGPCSPTFSFCVIHSSH